MKLILDTSAYAAFKRANLGAVEAIQDAERLFLPVIVLGELLGGFRLGGQAERNNHELALFLESPRVSVAPVTEHTAERYATIYKYLREQGRPIPTNDLWIAAQTMEIGGILLTGDAHFGRLPQIIVRPIVS